MLLFTRLETDFHKTLKFFRRTRHTGAGIGDVHLCDFASGALSVICDVEGHKVLIRRSCALVLNGEVREIKGGVGQSETKREERLRAVVFITAIAGENPFLIYDPLGAGFGIVV